MGVQRNLSSYVALQWEDTVGVVGDCRRADSDCCGWDYDYVDIIRLLSCLMLREYATGQEMTERQVS